nr:hypothetical protein [Tanacetum cinerariifolium]
SPRIPEYIFLAHLQSQGKPERKDISAEHRKQLVELIPWIKCQKMPLTSDELEVLEQAEQFPQ